MAKGSSLTAKELRNASPVDVLPFELVRKGAAALLASPVYYGTIVDARKGIISDLRKIHKDFDHFLTEADRAAIDALIEVAGALTEPGTVEGVIDVYTGLKYSATIVDRRDALVTVRQLTAA